MSNKALIKKFVRDQIKLVFTFFNASLKTNDSTKNLVDGFMENDIKLKIASNRIMFRTYIRTYNYIRSLVIDAFLLR